MSNSWAVHGNYTDTGFPLMANDFHTSSNLPSRYMFGELRWGETFVFGGMIAGIPGIINGRNKNFGWSMTVALADSSDLWEEEVNSEKT